MENIQAIGRRMQTLLWCADEEFLATMREVLRELNVEPEMARSSADAVHLVQGDHYDVIILDWGQGSPYELLDAIDQSETHSDSVLVAIGVDPVEMKQAFAAGVHFLIHKPASAVQIERCLRLAYCASVGKRRKRPREPVNIVASVRTRTQLNAEAMLVNLSETGAGMRLQAAYESEGASVAAGDEVELIFALPDRETPVRVKAQVMWASPSHCGIRFTGIVEKEMGQWLSDCVQRSRKSLRESPQAACA